MSGVFSRSTLAPTIAFFCLEHVFDKTLDLCVDFHVPAFANGVETDNLLIFSLIYSSPEMMEALNSVNVSFLAPTRSSGSHSVCLSVCLSVCVSVIFVNSSLNLHHFAPDQAAFMLRQTIGA